MGTYHDAYLFSPEQFAQALAPYLDALKQVDAGYPRLRAAALLQFDRSPQVRYLVANYGNWDRDRLLAGAPQDYPQGFHDVAFWLIVLLYGQLRSRPQALGLGGNWETLERSLPALGWDPRDAALLVHGRKFIDLAHGLPGQKTYGYWYHFHPRAPGGHAGWLGLEDVSRLHRLLAQTTARIQLTPSDLLPSQELLQSAYRSAVQMLAAAEDAHLGLCTLMAGQS